LAYVALVRLGSHSNFGLMILPIQTSLVSF